MSTSSDILVSLGLDRVIADQPFRRDAQGRYIDAAGARVVFADAATMRGLQHVIERERPGAWRATMKACGHACGRRVAAHLDAQLAALRQPALSALPLEACLAFLERTFAVHGWGRLALDLTHAADHGLLVARVEHSFFVEAMPRVDGFVDAMLAGILHGFFEHVSGQTLGSEEIGCGRHGAAHCTFVVGPADVIATVNARVGRDSVDAIVAALTGAR